MFAANLSLVLFKLLYFQVFNLYRDDLYTCYATGWEARCCLLRHFFGVNLPSQSCRWKLSWFHLAATICLVSKVPRAEVKGQNNLLLFCSDWLVMFYWSDNVLCSLCSVFVYSNGVHWIGEKDLNSSICHTKKSTKDTEPVDQNRLNHILATIHFDTRYFQGYTVLGIWHFRFFFFWSATFPLLLSFLVGVGENSEDVVHQSAPLVIHVLLWKSFWWLQSVDISPAQEFDGVA